MHKLSRFFRPLKVIEKKKLFGDYQIKSASEKLLEDYGIIRQAENGLFVYLPFGQRSIQKLINLVDIYMENAGCQKTSMPSLIKEKVWKDVGTYEKAAPELFKITDRSDAKYILCPTHEEAYAKFISSELLSYKSYPMLLYQVTSKFRDEMRPKHGLYRSKEFLMKDLYSFDIDQQSAELTYEKITKVYRNIFSELGVKHYYADTDAEAGIKMAHEFHYLTDFGDTRLYSCYGCHYSSSYLLAKERNTCFGCGLPIKESSYVNGVEIAHTFYFGTRYSVPLRAVYNSRQGKLEHLHMCSFGIGLSRLMTASVEILSKEHELRWPLRIAPFTLCIIPPRANTPEEVKIEQLLPEFYQLLQSIPGLKNDIIIDDRTDKTIGRRLMEAKCIGFPFILVIGKDSGQQTPLFELLDVNEDKQYLMPRSTVLQFFVEKFKKLDQQLHKSSYLHLT